jgi:hypothetical protein
VNGDQKMLKTDYMELRDLQVIYYFAHLMIREYYTSREHGQQFQKFPDIKQIVETWYNEQLEIVGGDGSGEFLYFCKHELQVSTRVHANNHKNIHKITFTDYEKITIPGISHHHIVIDCQCTRRKEKC